jgi:hypothetical protein
VITKAAAGDDFAVPDGGNQRGEKTTIRHGTECWELSSMEVEIEVEYNDGRISKLRLSRK